MNSQKLTLPIWLLLTILSLLTAMGDERPNPARRMIDPKGESNRIKSSSEISDKQVIANNDETTTPFIDNGVFEDSTTSVTTTSDYAPTTTEGITEYSSGEDDETEVVPSSTEQELAQSEEGDKEDIKVDAKFSLQSVKIVQKTGTIEAIVLVEIEGVML